MTNIVLPNETNALEICLVVSFFLEWTERLLLLHKRHSESTVVTASVNHVSFKYPIPEGGVVVVEAKVSRAFSTSMEIYCDVWLDNPITKEKIHTNEGIYTFVAVDKNNHPVAIPELIPQSDVEKARFDAALRRKELSLILSGKMKAQDSIELKKLFG